MTSPLRVGIRSFKGVHLVQIDTGDHVKIADLTAAIMRDSRVTDPDTFAVSASEPLSLTARPPGRGHFYRLDPNDTVHASGLRSGCEIQLKGENEAGPLPSVQAIAGTLIAHHVSGQQAEFTLNRGQNTLGRHRDNRVVLPGPSIDYEHGVIHVHDQHAEFVSFEDPPTRRKFTSREAVTVGDYALKFSSVVDRDVSSPNSYIHEWWHQPRIINHRYVVPHLEPQEFTLPQRPTPALKPSVPWVGIVIPVVLGTVLFGLTRSPFTLMIIAFSPVFALSSWLDQRRRNRKNTQRAHAEYLEQINHLRQLCHQARERERHIRSLRAPGCKEILRAIFDRTPLLWSQDPADSRACEIRLGTGSVRSVVQFKSSELTPNDGTESDSVLTPESDSRLTEAPVSVPLQRQHHFGVVGSREYCTARLSDVVFQQCALFSPAKLQVHVISQTTDTASSGWEWAQWLPHVDGTWDRQRLDPVSYLHQQLVLQQQQEDDRRLIVVCDTEDINTHERLKALAEQYTGDKLTVLWSVRSESKLPRSCHTWMSMHTESGTSALHTEHRQAILFTHTSWLETSQISHAARELSANWTHSQEATEHLPTQVTLTQLLDVNLGHRPFELQRRWRHTNTRHDISLAAPIGVDTHETVSLNLALQGPHSLVCGTTGAGKSEFLQTWVLALAATYSPERLNFLLIDFKGGATFSKLNHLPHSVGLVTDLSPGLTSRVLLALQAELKAREEIFHKHNVSDLAAMRACHTEHAPPQLIIVIDEFATLIDDDPDFLTGIVDVAQRGRSLGMHMILATQHPGRAITAAVRANTNLRIALRTASGEDSQQIIDSTVAASFPNTVPGRAAVRIGAGAPRVIQTGFVSDTELTPRVRLNVLSPVSPERLTHADELLNDSTVTARDEVEKIVTSIQNTAKRLKMAGASALWRPVLPEYIPLRDQLRCTSNKAASQPKLLLGREDRPELQSQPPLLIDFTKARHCMVIGGGGSGKSETLVSLGTSALASQQFEVAIISPREHPIFDRFVRHQACVEIASTHDTARVTRLLRYMADTRSREGYQAPSKSLLLVDDLEDLLQIGETHPEYGWERNILKLLHDGPKHGVHMVFSARRYANVPSAIRSTCGTQLVLPLTSPLEYAQLGMRAPTKLEPLPGRAVVLPGEIRAQIAHTTLADFEQIAGQPPNQAVTSPLKNTQIPGERGALFDLELLREISIHPHGIIVVSGSDAAGRIPTVDAIASSLSGLGVPLNRIGAQQLISGTQGFQELSANFQELKRGRTLVIIEHDPLDTDISWDLQRKLEHCDQKILLWHSADDPRTLAPQIRKPTFPLERTPGQGLYVRGQNITAVQCSLGTFRQKEAA